MPAADIRDIPYEEEMCQDTKEARFARTARLFQGLLVTENPVTRSVVRRIIVNRLLREHGVKV